jgi:hypothetical protein
MMVVLLVFAHMACFIYIHIRVVALRQYNRPSIGTFRAATSAYALQFALEAGSVLNLHETLVVTTPVTLVSANELEPFSMNCRVAAGSACFAVRIESRERPNAFVLRNARFVVDAATHGAAAAAAAALTTIVQTESSCYVELHDITASGYGSVLRMSASDALVADCTLRNATASALVAEASSILTLRNTVLEHNTAAIGNGGGAVQLISSSVHLDGVACNGNVAVADAASVALYPSLYGQRVPPLLNGRGGCLFASASAVTVGIGGASFADNVAAVGGAIALQSSTSLALTGTPSSNAEYLVSAMRNSAATYGGVLFAQDTASIAFAGVEMRDNVATRGGGGCFLDNAPSTFAGPSFDVSGNAAPLGGGGVLFWAERAPVIGAGVLSSTAPGAAAYGPLFATPVQRLRVLGQGAAAVPHVAGTIIAPAIRIDFLDAYNGTVTVLDDAAGVFCSVHALSLAAFAGTTIVPPLAQHTGSCVFGALVTTASAATRVALEFQVLTKRGTLLSTTDQSIGVDVASCPAGSFGVRVVQLLPNNVTEEHITCTLCAAGT